MFAERVRPHGRRTLDSTRHPHSLYAEKSAAIQAQIFRAILREHFHLRVQVDSASLETRQEYASLTCVGFSTVPPIDRQQNCRIRRTHGDSTVFTD